MFGRQKTDRNMEKEMAYRRNMRRLTECVQQMQQTAENRRKSAYELERSGQHQKALYEVKLMRTAQAMGNRLETMRGRMEMLHSLNDAAGMIGGLTEQCAALTGSLSRMLDPRTAAQTAAELERSGMMIENMLERTDALLGGIGSEAEMGMSHVEPEDEAELMQLLRESERSKRRRLVQMTDAKLDALEQQL